jgi:hypothetical protein
MARSRSADSTDTSQTTPDAAASEQTTTPAPSQRGQLLSKITVAAIGAQPKAKSLKEGEAFSVCVIMGEATKSTVAQSNYGDFLKFNGNFVGVNMRTGERFRSAALILPQLVEHVLDTAITEAGGPVEFALEIGVKYSEKGNTGYVYTIKPLLEPSETDPMERLLSKVSGMIALPALPPPAKA